jgi:hexosaminidase
LFYDCYPLEYVDTDEQRQLILGGEVCMWGEYVNEHSVMQRVWPRASAAAERLWSAANVKDMTDAQRRIEEHACRMNRRGIEAQPPNGPGVCL